MAFVVVDIIVVFVVIDIVVVVGGGLILRVFVVVVVVVVVEVVTVVVLGRWYEHERVDAASMTAELAHPLAALEVPATRRAVVRAAEDELSRADDAIHRRLVTFKHRHARTRSHVPLADRLIGAPANHVRVLD